MTTLGTDTPLGRVAAPQADATLLKRAQAGSRSAFGEIVRRHERNIIAFCQRRVHAGVDAEDVAQEAFVRAWRAIDSFDLSRPLRPWLLTIASRVAVTHNRKARSGRRIIATFAESCAPAPHVHDGTLEHTMARESAGVVWEIARRELTPRALGVLWLRYGEELPTDQIAEVMGMSHVHVRVLLSRARKRIASRIQAMEESADAGYRTGAAS